MSDRADWSKWLPKKALRGVVTLTPGRVIGVSMGCGSWVLRILSFDIGEDVALCEVLASDNGIGVGAKDWSAVPGLSGSSAILIQDVGQHEPTPPHVLYRETVAAIKGPHGTLECPCGGTDYLGAPHDEGCAVPRRRPAAEPAPHHNADYLTALAALEASEGVTRETRPVHHCRHVTCRVCRPVVAEPFVAKVDLYDLLPDAP